MKYSIFCTIHIFFLATAETQDYKFEKLLLNRQLEYTTTSPTEYEIKFQHSFIHGKIISSKLQCIVISISINTLHASIKQSEICGRNSPHSHCIPVSFCRCSNWCHSLHISNDTRKHLKPTIKTRHATHQKNTTLQELPLIAISTAQPIQI